jgi:hypothetical protein
MKLKSKRSFDVLMNIGAGIVLLAMIIASVIVWRDHEYGWFRYLMVAGWGILFLGVAVEPKSQLQEKGEEEKEVRCA